MKHLYLPVPFPLFQSAPTRRSRGRPAAFALLLAVSPSVFAAPGGLPGSGPDPSTTAWREATRYLFRESEAAFAAAPENTETRLGRAALLLLRQPRTQENLERAVEELRPLAAAPAPDAVAPLARYLLARIEQVHRPSPDLVSAAAHYRLLIQEHPGHLLAEQAWTKLALIELHAPGLSSTERLALHAEFAARADSLTHQPARRDLHLALGAIARQHALGDESILRHYVAADQVGVVRPVQRAGVQVIIGETARRLGRTDLAREYFERFLAEFPRDYRRRTIQDRLAALSPASLPAAPR